jgi:hypothetical protein
MSQGLAGSSDLIVLSLNLNYTATMTAGDTLQQDLEQRETLEKLQSFLASMTLFLNRFGALGGVWLNAADKKSRLLLGQLDERLAALERRMAFLEARVFDLGSGANVRRRPSSRMSIKPQVIRRIWTHLRRI